MARRRRSRSLLGKITPIKAVLVAGGAFLGYQWYTSQHQQPAADRAPAPGNNVATSVAAAAGSIASLFRRA